MVGGKFHRLQPAHQCQVPDAALACARGLELAGGRRFDRVGEVLDGLVRRVRLDLDARRIFVHQRQRRVVFRRQLGQALPVHHRDFHGDDAERVAIRLRGRDRRVADHAGTTGAVDDVDWLAEVFFQQSRDDARGGVCTAACAPRTDHLDRAARIGALAE
jgi:hypothetical protein